MTAPRPDDRGTAVPGDGNPPRSELRVARRGDVLWTLLSEAGRDVELRVESADDGPLVGEIYKARVADVLRGLGAAFLDLGTGRNAFLPLAGAAPDLAGGAQLLVQVEREALGDKAARLSGSPALPGRRLVLLPADSRRVVSRRIRDAGERERLAAVIEALPGDEGFIARTAAEGAGDDELVTEARRLAEEWAAVRDAAATTTAPARLRREPDLLLRHLRDAPRGGFDEVIVDCRDDLERAAAYLGSVDPASVPRVRLEAGAGDCWRRVRAAIDEGTRPRVWLPRGGYLVIEVTEALVSIDVNTGKNTGRRGGGDAALETNLEAAAEIGRRLRLFDLGGLVIVDFVQVDDAGGRRRILDALGEALRPDPARVRIGRFSEFGLVELSRERARPGPLDRWLRPCGQCAGSGRVPRRRD